MPIILLIRHGETDYVKKGKLAGRLPGVHLNETGRKQAQQLAEKLSQAPVKALYASPLERTMETAEPIAKALNLEIIPRPGLIETNVGDWQDQTIKSLRRLKLWKLVQSSPSLVTFPAGESFADSQQRISTEIIGIVAGLEPKEMVICVSHADPIRLAVAYFIGLPLDLFQRLNVSPGSLTALAIGENGSRLLTLNVDLSFNFPKP